MKRIDVIGNVALLVVVVLIVFLSPNLSNYVALITYSHEATEARRSHAEQEKERVTVMRDSVRHLGIEDKNLEACIEEEGVSRARIDPDATGGRYRAAELDTVSCPRRGIRSLDGIEGLPGLRHLILYENGIRNLRPLSGLKALESLDLSDNRVIDISPLADLPALARLNLRGNRVADVRPLARMSSLKTLSLPDLSGVYCADIEFLQEVDFIQRATSLGQVGCEGRMTRELARVLEKDPEEWSVEEEKRYLHYKINKHKKNLRKYDKDSR